MKNDKTKAFAFSVLGGIYRVLLLIFNWISLPFNYFSKSEISPKDIKVKKYFNSFYLWATKKSMRELYGSFSIGSDTTIFFHYPLLLSHFWHLSFYTNKSIVQTAYFSNKENNRVGYLLFNGNILSFLQDSNFELSNEAIKVKRIEIGFLGQKKYYSQVYFNLDYDYRGWYSYFYLHVFKVQADLRKFPIEINIAIGSMSCSIFSLFETDAGKDDEELPIKYIFEQTISRLECLFIETEKELNSDKGYKLVVPENLKIPLQQYFNYFEKFVQETKGAKIKFDIEKIDEGLQIHSKTESDVEPDTIKDWLNEFVELAKQPDGNMVVNFSEKSIKSEEQASLLFLDIKGQISHLKESLRRVEFENRYLKRENDLLHNDRTHLMKQSESLVGSFMQNIKMIPFKSGQKESKEELVELLRHGYIEKLIEILRQRFKHQEDVDDLVNIEAQWNDIKKRFETGILHESERFVSQNKLRNALIDFIHKAPE